MNENGFLGIVGCGETSGALQGSVHPDKWPGQQSVRWIFLFFKVSGFFISHFSDNGVRESFQCDRVQCLRCLDIRRRDTEQESCVEFANRLPVVRSSLNSGIQSDQSKGDQEGEVGSRFRSFVAQLNRVVTLIIRTWITMQVQTGEGRTCGKKVDR